MVLHIKSIIQQKIRNLYEILSKSFIKNCFNSDGKKLKYFYFKSDREMERLSSRS